MVDGETQKFQGFLPDNPVTIVEHTTPYGYSLIVKDPSTKVTCPAVSTGTSTKQLTYYD